MNGSRMNAAIASFEGGISRDRSWRPGGPLLCLSGEEEKRDGDDRDEPTEVESRKKKPTTIRRGRIRRPAPPIIPSDKPGDPSNNRTRATEEGAIAC